MNSTGEPYTAGSEIPRIYISYWFAIKLVSLELIMDGIPLAILRNVTKKQILFIEGIWFKMLFTLYYMVSITSQSRKTYFWS